MSSGLPSLEELRRVNAGFPFPEPVRRWKEKGGRVVGFLCTYIPEEVLHAAGLLPLRLTADSRELELEEANAYLYIYTCSFVRSVLELALKGELVYLDGIVGCSTCDPIRRLDDVWRRYLPIPLLHELTVPRKFTEAAHQLYADQVRGFKEAVERDFGVAISDDRLWDSINLYNRTRRLLKQLYALRRAEAPPLSGAETLEVMNAAFRMPREDYNRLLERLLSELAQSDRRVNGRYRIMVSGSILNNPEFLHAIEEQGGLVVVDDLCTGVRYWSDPVPEGDFSPLTALSQRYLNRFPCARMFPARERFRRILSLVQEYRVEGVISPVIRYCAPYLRDRPLLRQRLERQGVPVLELDVEYGMGASGQLRTRVQAFLEMLEGRKK